ncbi:type II toxin-antitoxin system prevent-host-death family antitoxin [Caminibacter mediatlanticus]|uniref:Antitoxin n=1 Tax=Caminibacter mediatlanticus TB-2 TaxID=391592 RepID=A0AAI9F2M2_9BACT|nr:type II toxin-antitoxin system prevent-host-death family antitoxin [Caminibacter mediatlanticus]EDM23736.1 hypothetical protein CMTB2_00674 [Caminibacter mediatlanticus TB-2]
MIVSANEIKRHGVSLFDKLFEKANEIIISVRGKKKYVVIDYEEYKKFREYELEKAYREVMEDIEKGDFHSDLEKHIKMIKNV